MFETAVEVLAGLRTAFVKQPPDDFILVSGEIGVGAGVVLDRQLFRGVRGLAGELGHVVVDPAGPSCGCGSNGCLEQFAGQDALLRRAKLAGGTAELTTRAGAGTRMRCVRCAMQGRRSGWPWPA